MVAERCSRGIHLQPLQLFFSFYWLVFAHFLLPFNLPASLASILATVVEPVREAWNTKPVGGTADVEIFILLRGILKTDE